MIKLNNLQILRGISALLVCCFHFRGCINFENFQLGDILFKKGSIGVPVFFVISGFIITYTTKKIDFSIDTLRNLSTFYKRRFIRIIPLYYMLTFAWMIIGGNFFLYFHGELLSRFIYSILFLPQKDTSPIVYLGWSLNYEMFFYLMFGISLLFKTKRHIFIITFFITSYISGLIFSFENTYLQMATSYLNLYFVAGILFSLLLDKVSIPKNWGTCISLLGILLFLSYLFKMVDFTNNLATLLMVSLFVLSFLLFDFTFHVKGNKFLVFLGNISYSLYLSHPFVEIFLRKFKIEGYMNIPYFIFRIFLAIAVASFFYYFIEKKITEYLKLKLKA